MPCLTPMDTGLVAGSLLLVIAGPPARIGRHTRNGTVMKKLVLSSLPVVATSLLVAAGPAIGAPHTARAASSVRVVMRDPGCHWFAVGGKFKTKLSVKGPAVLSNLDEAALKITGTGATKRVAVGRKITLARGRYTIVMVHQPSDDNTLKLVVS